MRKIRHGLIVDGHLGGYVAGGDPNTTYPTLWRWLIEERAVRSVLDVGCGDGTGAMTHFRGLGLSAVIGVDGIPQDDETILVHDFTDGPWPTPGSWFADPGHPGFDLVWSCEFVEHVDDEYVPNFLSAFRLGRLVLMTHAVPGQRGHHHVNCRPESYWISRAAEIGYVCDRRLTDDLRALAVREDIPAEANYFARTGLALIHEKGLGSSAVGGVPTK